MNVDEILAEIATFGGFFGIVVGGDSDGWVPVRQCYSDGCVDLIGATAERCGTTDLRIGASLVQFSHASRLWSPLLACTPGYGVLPDLAHLQRSGTGTELRLPDAFGESACLDDALPNRLYRIVVEDHLEPLAAGMRVKMAPRLLHGNAAAALVAAADELTRARPELRDRVVALTESLLDMGVLRGTGELTGLTFRRRSCCLYYRVPGGTHCRDCALAGRQ
ncbi:(2Fe-2S)-binding protein [Mycolicibacterium wolinskyi]|uniref:(2Fe-2S)-binding protein n=1 Tax=Mycolicibacterium wolinskyi TaxID=59750 RepID=UPI0039177C55